MKMEMFREKVRQQELNKAFFNVADCWEFNNQYIL